MVARLLITLFISLAMLLPSVSGMAAMEPTRTLVDQLGRTVILPRQVQRIIPMGGATRFVVYLQAFELVVGVEAMEGRMPATAGRPYNMAIRSQAAKLPVIGEGRQKPVNPEAIIALRPDLIVTAESDRGQADKLSRITGSPVLALDYGGWGVLKPDKIKEALNLLGRALGREKRATELVDYINSMQQEFKRKIPADSAEQVYIGAVSQRGVHGITSTDADYFPLLAARGTNLAQRLGKHGHLFIDKEQLLVWNPAILLLDGGGLKLVGEDYRQHHNFYERLAAVKNSRVYLTLPYNNYHTNLELALANSWYIAKILYPARFADTDPAKKTDELCKKFAGITCYEQLRQEFGGFGRLQLDGMKIHAN